MKVQCCVCKKVRHGKRWANPATDELTGEAVSHGYCPTCAEKAFDEIRRHTRLRAQRAAFPAAHAS